MKISYSDNNVKAEFEVVRATVMIGMRRSMLIAEAEMAGEEDEVSLFLRRAFYPSLIASAPQGKLIVDDVELSWPPTFEEFITLPEPLAIEWETATYEMNPHWLPQLPETEKKK